MNFLNSANHGVASVEVVLVPCMKLKLYVQQSALKMHSHPLQRNTYVRSWITQLGFHHLSDSDQPKTEITLVNTAVIFFVIIALLSFQKIMFLQVYKFHFHHFQPFQPTTKTRSARSKISILLLKRTNKKINAENVPKSAG